MKFAIFSYKLEILIACWLAFLQEWTRAYTIESMSAACASGYGSRKQIRLSARGSTSAASLLIDVTGRGVEPKTCGVDVHVPKTHVIAFRLVHSAPKVETREDEVYRSPCPLAVYGLTKGRRLGRRLLQSIDLCNAEDVPQFSYVLPFRHMTLIWMPPHGNFSNRLQASEIVVTAIGEGVAVCNTPPRHTYFHCTSWLSLRCVARELVCDGRVNCPGLGGDEDPELCGSLGFEVDSTRPTTRRKNVTKLMAPTILHLVTTADTTSDVTNRAINLVNISSVSVDDGESFTTALSKYGPWGFVMLGMLICGSVLMLCGLWECICRSTKVVTEAPVMQGSGPFVISSERYAWNATPSPPSYEDLDQPPAYSTLFPHLANKIETNELEMNAENGSTLQRY